MRRLLLLGLMPVLCSAAAGPVPGAPAGSSPPRRMTAMVPMRDGTRLAVDLWLPPGDGPWPAALNRTPFGKERISGDRLVAHAIVLVAQDQRGRGASEGEWRLGTDDAWGPNQDGADTIAWIRKQPWCNGKAATFGVPIPQMLLAGAGPEGVVGQHVNLGPLSLYHSVFYQNGVFRKPWEEFVRRFSRSLDVLQHPSYDTFWRGMDLRTRLRHVRWPMVYVTGWFEGFSPGAIDAFTELQERGGEGARGRQHLVIGLRYHFDEALEMRRATGPDTNRVGELTFPETAAPPHGAPGLLEWLRFWLKGEPTVRADEPAVRYYVMGDVDDPRAPGKVWRTADRWPPPSRPLRLYLAPDGSLTRERPPTTTTRAYDYDPAKPVPTLGGAEDLLPAGPMDQRPVEARPDVLVFTTPPLAEPLEVTGRLRVRLYAATSARDTDFTAKLCDVYPDGRSMLVADGIVRARYRRSLEKPEPITPGRRYGYDIDLWSTSIVFNRGHRIRVSISSSNAPRFEPNPNTWPGESAPPVVARQTIIAGGTEASHIVLPVIDR